MKIRTVLFYLGIIVTALHGCSPHNLETAPSRLGLEYFPLESGQYRQYAVTEILYNTQGQDTLRYFLQEKVLDPFDNFEGEISYRIERSKKNKLNDPWVQDSIWAARRNEQQAVMVENNIPYLKLVFPVKEKKEWDGNSLNDADNDAYIMNDIRMAYDDSVGLVYENTLTVVQEENYDPIVQTNLRKEIYAENIGLVYKESIILNFCTVTNECDFGEITSGRDYKMKLIDYGME